MEEYGLFRVESPLCGQTLVNDDNKANLLPFGLSLMGGLTMFTKTKQEQRKGKTLICNNFRGSA